MSEERRSSRAEAKAAKARAKALRPWYRKKRWYALGLLALIVIIIIAATAGGGSKPTSVPSPAASSSAASAAPSTASAAASPASTPAAPTSPAMTTAQQQAVDAAQNYLSEGQGFSYEGLLQQLTSSAGNGFATSDAKFAINYLKPDWDQQAVDSAQDYLNIGQGFSYTSLTQQLTSTAGAGFTQAQAAYAISHLNPDWNSQAVEAAKGYMKIGGFSRSSLIDQLTSSAGNGFTEAQAEYAANKVGL